MLVPARLNAAHVLLMSARQSTDSMCNMGVSGKLPIAFVPYRRLAYVCTHTCSHFATADWK